MQPAEYCAEDGRLRREPKAQHAVKAAEEATERGLGGQLLHKLQAKLQAGPKGLWAAWHLYAAQPCLPAGLALALLYCSVMSPGLLMTGAACCAVRFSSYPAAG